MPILSYLACPAPGRREDLTSALRSMDECELIESDEGDVMILVTETRGKEEEDRLQKKLGSIESLAFLALAFGHGGESEPEGAGR